VKKQHLIILTTLALFDAVGLADGAEFYGQADVIRYEPVTRTYQMEQTIPGCLSKRPDTHNLVELLNWDLESSQCLQIVTDTKITGYKVYYEWDNQQFSQVTHSHPGQTIPVHITID
jgi:uncharacterized protein YcfJ